MTTPRLTYSTERLGALSDGVFSIVLTLLVLDLKVPEVPAGLDQEQLLIADLRAQIPNFIAWLISVVLVARFWVAHHAIVASLAKCHLGTMVWNFVVLALMSLVPFAASLISRYEFDAVAVVIFAGLMGATGLSLGLFARHATTELHLRRDVPAGNLDWHWKYHSRVLPSLAVVSLAFVGVDEVAALMIWGVEPAAALLATWRHRPPA